MRHSSCVPYCLIRRGTLESAWLEYGENVDELMSGDGGLKPGRVLGLTYIPATTATGSFRCLTIESYLFVEETPDRV